MAAAGPLERGGPALVVPSVLLLGGKNLCWTLMGLTFLSNKGWPKSNGKCMEGGTNSGPFYCDWKNPIP